MPDPGCRNSWECYGVTLKPMLMGGIAAEPNRNISLI